MPLHPAQQTSDDITLLVDCRFTMVLAASPSADEEKATAFLLVRDSTGKDVCVGYCRLQFDGTWHTRLTVSLKQTQRSLVTLIVVLMLWCSYGLSVITLDRIVLPFLWRTCSVAN
ncbi:hypothetical protein [Comamonas sp. C24C]